MDSRKTVLFYRVDVAKAQRNSLTLDPSRFKEVVEYSLAHKRIKDWRKQMGALGLIEVSDFEEGAYSEYGLKKERIEGVRQVENLLGSNADLQKKVAELEAKLAKKNTPKKDKEPEIKDTTIYENKEENNNSTNTNNPQ